MIIRNTRPILPRRCRTAACWVNHSSRRFCEGELSLLFFDGVFSHVVRKRLGAGDYRVQFQYGGTGERVEVGLALVAQARICLDHALSLPFYAHVDGVMKDGRFLLMELEVLEPLMFLTLDAAAPGRFARAIRGRLPR